MVKRVLIALLTLSFTSMMRADVIPGETSTGSKPSEPAPTKDTGPIGEKVREQFLRPGAAEMEDRRDMFVSPVRDVPVNIGLGRVVIPDVSAEQPGTSVSIFAPGKGGVEPIQQKWDESDLGEVEGEEVDERIVHVLMGLLLLGAIGLACCCFARRKSPA